MSRFALLAIALNLLPVVLFALLRHRVARLPQPGLWWLALVSLTTVGTLLLAESLL